MAIESQESFNTPLLVFDGDCYFCRRWVERWKKTTGDRVHYEAYQSVAWKYPEISDREFAQSIQYFERGKPRRQGADAVFHALARGGMGGKLLAFFYDHFLPFAAVSEVIYRFVARNRSSFSALTWRLFGDIKKDL